MLPQNQNIEKLVLGQSNDLKAIYRSTLTVDATVKTLATDIAAIIAAKLGKPKAVQISVISSEPSAIVARYTLEGTDPVATTTGLPMYNKDPLLITELSNLQRFKVTREAAYTTTLQLVYYK